MTTVHQCPNCHASYDEGDRFCERCGAQLTDAGPASGPHDRTELDLTLAAAVSDRGLVHSRNEDSFQLEVASDGSFAVVVCDGTSSASAGNAAAREAAAAAAAVLSQAIAGPAGDPAATLAEAMHAATDAVVLVPWTTRTMRVDPACTLVSALCRGDQITIGWVGDSRAYWLDGEGLRQLTVDDSFATEAVAKGLMTPEQAANSPFLHSITHWVGPNSPERPPQTASLSRSPGRLVLCTDGLWNYAATLEEFGALLAGLPGDASAIEAARALTDAALAQGGQDNITVAVVDVDPAP